MTTWLPTLKTATPQEGYELAVKMARTPVTEPGGRPRWKRSDTTRYAALGSFGSGKYWIQVWSWT